MSNPTPSPTISDSRDERSGVDAVAAGVEEMDARTDTARAAAAQEMRAASWVLAAAIRAQHPDARWIYLEASDQGDWMDATGWGTGPDPANPDDRQRLDLPDEVAFAGWHLDTPKADLGLVPGLNVIDTRRGYYWIDIDPVLALHDPATSPTTVIDLLVLHAQDEQTRTTARTRTLAALVAATPDTERHLLIDAVAQALRDHPHPLAPTVCQCGHPIRSVPETDDDGDQVHSEGHSVELDYSVGQQQTAHQALWERDGTVTYVWSTGTDRNDQHRIAQMCPTCQRLYTIPATETITYW